MTGTHDTGNRNRPTATVPDRPTLEPDERLWLEGYLERLRNAPGGLLKRLMVYGSKARGDAGPESDVDVLVLVGDVPEAVRNAEKLIDGGGDDPDDVNHQVVVKTEADWLRDMEKELPFPRNVEAEGIQLHPEYRAARMPPGVRPAVTRKGMQHAVPVWMKAARGELPPADTIEETEAAWLKHPGMVARQAFDAVFFSAIAWCLTRGVSVVRRKDLPGSIERHLIEPGALNADWQDRIRTLSAAWKAEVEWDPHTYTEPTADDAAAWLKTAWEFYALARDAVAAADIDIDPPAEAGSGGDAAETDANAVTGGGRRKPRTSARGWVEGRRVGAPPARPGGQRPGPEDPRQGGDRPNIQIRVGRSRSPIEARGLPKWPYPPTAARRTVARPAGVAAWYSAFSGASTRRARTGDRGASNSVPRAGGPVWHQPRPATACLARSLAGRRTLEHVH